MRFYCRTSIRREFVPDLLAIVQNFNVALKNVQPDFPQLLCEANNQIIASRISSLKIGIHDNYYYGGEPLLAAILIAWDDDGIPNSWLVEDIR